MKNLLKKKAFIIPSVTILCLILFAIGPKLIGVITLASGIGSYIYLYTKNEKFKLQHIIIKTIKGVTICFVVIIFSISGLACASTASQQNKVTTDQERIEQQAKDEQTKKELEEKEKAEADKKAAEEKAINDQKAANLVKFNLKQAVVSRVVDGDTVELSDGNKVRFIGVNTPESTTKIEPYGKEASDYTKNQLTGKTVYLEKDVSETDKYGRLLRYVWLDIPKEISDSEIRAKMYNANLVANGYAEVSTYPPDVKYQEYFTKYNAEARSANKGLWAINHNGTTKGDSNNTSSSSSSNQSSGNTNSNSSSSSSSSSGTTTNEPAQGNRTVYWTSGGKSYHYDRNCKTLSRSKNVLEGPVSACPKTDPCDICVK